jgi:hypothetical protein
VVVFQVRGVEGKFLCNWEFLQLLALEKQNKLRFGKWYMFVKSCEF